MGRHNEHIELNPTSTSNDHANLHSDHITSIPNTDYIFLTV